MSEDVVLRVAACSNHEIAEALLQARDALAGVLESPAELDDERMSYVPRQVSRPDWDDCKAALARLKAVLGR